MNKMKRLAIIGSVAIMFAATVSAYEIAKAPLLTEGARR